MQSTANFAFLGAHDPNDEPASILLERIMTKGLASPSTKSKRKSRTIS
jgi:hypothetical protein